MHDDALAQSTKYLLQPLLYHSRIDHSYTDIPSAFCCLLIPKAKKGQLGRIQQPPNRVTRPFDFRSSRSSARLPW